MWERACSRRRCGRRPSLIGCTPLECGSWLACDSGISVYISIIWVTAAYGSALTAGHFWKRAPKVTKRALAPTLGTSPRLGVPVIRHGFGGPPPRAIHGAGRLNRHPCRFTPQIHAEFRPACLTGRLRSKSKAKHGGLTADLSGVDQERMPVGAEWIQQSDRPSHITEKPIHMRSSYWIVHKALPLIRHLTHCYTE